MRRACLFCCAVLLLTPAPASAQESAAPPAVAASEAESETRSREPTRLYVGMWTLHLKDDAIGLTNNWVVGLAYRGFFGATFMNSFGRRAWTAGYQRTAVSSNHGPLTASLGYRLGAVSGYDGRFMNIARHTPVLPLASAFGNVDVGRVGIEVSYTFVIVSVAVSYRLGR
jgi:hypothetical protein